MTNPTEAARREAERWLRRHDIDEMDGLTNVHWRILVDSLAKAFEPFCEAAYTTEAARQEALALVIGVPGPATGTAEEFDAAVDRIALALTAAYDAGKRDGVAEERERAAVVAERTHADDGWNAHYRNAGIAIATAIRRGPEGGGNG